MLTAQLMDDGSAFTIIELLITLVVISIVLATGSHNDLQTSRYSWTSSLWQTSGMASGIVSLQAQYGFDDRSGLQTSPQVTFWSSSLIDADGNKKIGDANDLTRLIAIRFAVVARSS